MSSYDETRERLERCKRNDFYRALVDRNPERAAYAALSTEGYLQYLGARDACDARGSAGDDSAEPTRDSDTPEAAAHRWLESVIAGASSLPMPIAIECVVSDLEKAFRFGPLWRPKSADPGDDLALAEFDGRKVALLKAILAETGMPLAAKPMPLLEVSRLALHTPMSWSRCKALAELLRPNDFCFQSALDDLGELMYHAFRRSSLGGVY